MAATTLEEAKEVMESKQKNQPSKKPNQQAEVELAECHCCGLAEECTPAYITRVRELYCGCWICGLCAEAVEEERHRSRLGISSDQALIQHIKFCQQFKSSRPPTNPTQNLISAVKHLLWRTLDSPKKKKGSVYPSMSVEELSEKTQH